MSDPQDELEARLASAAQRWQDDVPTASFDPARLERPPSRTRVSLLAAAAVLVAVGSAYAIAGTRGDDNPQPAPAIPPTPTPSLAHNNPLSVAEMSMATEVAKRRQAKVRGTFVGAVAAPLVYVDRNQANAGCPIGERLIRVRLVWEDDANFDNAGAFLPDGPFKARSVVIDPATSTPCRNGGSRYRAVGARLEETLLYGTRPEDPTGELPLAPGADRVKVTAANGKTGYVDRAVLSEIIGDFVRGPAEALKWQQQSAALTWTKMAMSVSDADGTRVGIYVLSHSHDGSAEPPDPTGSTLEDGFAFAEAVAQAAAHRDQSELPSPGAAGGHWADLVRYLGGHDVSLKCRLDSPNNYDCGVKFDPQGPDQAYFYVTRKNGSWVVTYVSNVID